MTNTDQCQHLNSDWDATCDLWVCRDCQWSAPVEGADEPWADRGHSAGDHRGHQRASLLEAESMTKADLEKMNAPRRLETKRASDQLLIARERLRAETDSVAPDQKHIAIALKAYLRAGEEVARASSLELFLNDATGEYGTGGRILGRIRR